MSLIQTVDPTLARALILLVPAFTLVALFFIRGFTYFQMVGMLLGMMLNTAYLFLFNILAIELGFWHYSPSANMFYTIPIDLMLGWVIFWGALIPFCFEKFPIYFPLLFAGVIDLALMPQLPQLLTLSDSWFIGEALLLTTCLLPTLIIYRLTVKRLYVGWRAFLQSVIWGGWVIFLVPGITLVISEDDIFSILHRDDWKLFIFFPAMGLSMMLGYWALYEFAVRGNGTPIPFDPPQKLVSTGPYAYLANPLQVSTVLMFLCMAFVFESYALLAGALSMVVFAELFVRWHHTIDIHGRFGEDWFTYRKHVKNWWPRYTAYKAN